MEMSKRIRYWLLDRVLDEIRECTQAIEAHKILAKHARSDEEAQAHYGHISDLQDFIKALEEFQSKVRNGEVI